MDVTSLLNQSAISAYCKENSRESATPSAVLARGTLPSGSLPTPSPDRTSPQRDWETHHPKGRTPWNAGGYALPFQTELKFRSNSISSSRSTSENLGSDTSNDLHSAIDRYSRNGSNDLCLGDMDASQSSSSLSLNLRPSSIREDDEAKANIGTSEPLGHKFSDSHSSLSSYGSRRSRPHSRLSSATTVSGGYSACPSLAEVAFPEDELSPPGTSQASTARPISQQQIHQNYHLQQQGKDVAEPRRPSSPSDAVLNMKGTTKLLREGQYTNESAIPESRVPIAPKSHKRAISAPSFSHGAAYSSTHTVPLPTTILPLPHNAMAVPKDGTPRSGIRGKGIAHEQLHLSRSKDTFAKNDSPTTSNLAHSRTQSSSAIGDASFGVNDGPAVGTTPTSTNEDDDECRCMFVENCDTGSQLRKAISHLFGRNKTCTLKIPKEVWVYYCRKHYQRIRYRNARSYPVNQMELVQLQIERLQKWSDKNIQRGKGAHIKSWALSLRKREEKRLLGSKGTKGDDNDAVSLTPAGGSSIPRWIIEKVGEGYTTKHMFEIAARLRDEIINGNLTQVPEIEFLPDIVDDNEDASAKPTRHRRQNTGSSGPTKMSKRKAEEFPSHARHSPTYSDDPYMAYRHDQGDDTDEVISPSGKRPRTARGAVFPNYHIANNSSPYRPSLSQGPPYGAPSYGQTYEANAFPPRAPNVVPRMQPMSYGPASPHDLHTRYGHERPGHARYASYHGSYGAEYASEPYYQPSVGQHPVGQHSVFQWSGQESPRSHQVLPPIHDQAHGQGHGQTVYEVDGPGFSLRPRARGGNSRPMHQRSASAYTPASRRLPSFARPSSSGTDDVPSGVRYEAGPHDSPYELYSQTAQGRCQDEYQEHQYNARPEWSEDYGQSNSFTASAPGRPSYTYDQAPGHEKVPETASPVYAQVEDPEYPAPMPADGQHSL